MEYSQIIKQLSKDYNLQPQDVFFSILCANGLGRAESFAHIYQPPNFKESTIKNGAAKIVKDKPGILKLIQDLKARVIPVTAELKTNNQAKKDQEAAKASGWRSNQTPEENLKRITEENLYKLDPEKKISEARNLAKLYGVKDSIKETIYYYLPLSCRQCSLYINNERARVKVD